MSVPSRLSAPALIVAPPPRRMALLTDFGVGPYVGQVLLRLAALAPGVPAVSLSADLPACRPDLAAWLLPGLLRGMPARSVYLCVVDPGVGGERGILAARIGPDWLLAPDNGLLAPLLRRSPAAAVWRVHWRPRRLSDSFHGRDLFAPLAAALWRGRLPGAVPTLPAALVGADWPLEQALVCYVDGYGNLITGLDGKGLSDQALVTIAGSPLRYARTFCAVAPGTAFWYRNAFGLVEIAVSRGSAAGVLGVGPGAIVTPS